MPIIFGEHFRRSMIGKINMVLICTCRMAFGRFFSLSFFLHCALFDWNWTNFRTRYIVKHVVLRDNQPLFVGLDLLCMCVCAHIQIFRMKMLVVNYSTPALFWIGCDEVIRSRWALSIYVCVCVSFTYSFVVAVRKSTPLHNDGWI